MEITVKDENTLYPNVIITEELKVKSRDDFQALLDRRIAELKDRK